jgi:magnesium-transporting ATPase (P-type)
MPVPKQATGRAGESGSSPDKETVVMGTNVVNGSAIGLVLETGTLTIGQSELQHYFTLEGQSDDRLLLYALLCNSSRENGDQSGNPLDVAIWQHPQSSQLQKEMPHYPLVEENEFDFNRRRMSRLGVPQPEKPVFST